MTNTDPFSPENYPYGRQHPDPTVRAREEARLRLALTTIAYNTHFDEMKEYMRTAPLPPSNMGPEQLAAVQKRMILTHGVLADAMLAAEYAYEQAKLQERSQQHAEGDH